MAASPDHALRQRLREESGPLLAHRARVAMGLAAAVILASLVLDYLVHRPIFPLLAGIAVAQLLVYALGALALRGPPSWRRAAAVPLWTTCFAFGSGALSDIASRNFFGIIPLAVAAMLLGATLMPWGAYAQTALALCAWGSAAICLTVLTGAFAPISHLVVGFGVVAIGSVFVTRGLEETRLQRLAAEEALAVAKERAEEEAAIASQLLTVTETLSKPLGRDEMLDEVTRLARDALHAGWCMTLLWNAARRGFDVAAGAGPGAETMELLRHADLGPGTVPALEGMRPPELLVIEDTRDLDERSRLLLGRGGTRSVLVAPIGSLDQLLGMALFGYDVPQSFGDRARRLATGIANATAVALDRARLITTLQDASRLKSEFVATMSHELRTPLNVIIGYTEMALDGRSADPDADVHGLLARVRESSLELLELVNATLDLGRLEAGRDSPVREPIRLDELFAELQGRLGSLAAPGVELQWRDQLRGDLVMSDRTKLATILRNLVGNALKFTTRGRVSVAAWWTRGMLCVQVRDTGTGIPANALPVIFEMFRQVDASLTRRFGGVGLGLHIVQRLVGLLGGRVFVESAVGVGSTFTVEIPASVVRAVKIQRRTA